MNAIVPFNFDDQPIRIEDREGQPWFVLADVCRVLGLANVSDAAARLRPAERRDDLALTDAIGREQAAIAVNEAGLYRLIMRSRKPAAERFSDWVVADVLPAIRRTGGYGTPRPALDVDDNETLRALLLGRMDRLDEIQPKADAYDRLTDTRGALGVREAAKALKMGQQELVEWLGRNRWAYRSTATGRLQAYREREIDGTLEHKTSRIRVADGPDKVATTLQITAKGLAKIAAALGARG